MNPPPRPSKPPIMLASMVRSNIELSAILANEFVNLSWMLWFSTLCTKAQPRMDFYVTFLFCGLIVVAD